MATPLDFAKALLSRLGMPWTDNRLVGLVAFESMEGGHFVNPATRYNPLNTMLPYAGSHSAVGNVQAYNSWYDGIEATARTMAQSNMRAIIDALKADVDPSSFLTAVTSTPWCPRVDAYGRPTECRRYDTVDPYVQYRQYKDRSDQAAPLVAVEPKRIHWKTVLIGSAAILAVAAVVVYHTEYGRFPWQRRSVRENPARRRRPRHYTRTRAAP